MVVYIFTDSVTKSLCPDVVCVSVPSQKTRFPLNLRLLVKECFANIGIPLDIFGFFVVSMIF